MEGPEYTFAISIARYNLVGVVCRLKLGSSSLDSNGDKFDDDVSSSENNSENKSSDSDSGACTHGSSRSIHSIAAKSFGAVRHSITIAGDALRLRKRRRARQISSCSSTPGPLWEGTRGASTPRSAGTAKSEQRRRRRGKRKPKNRKVLTDLMSFRRRRSQNIENFSSLKDVIMADPVDGWPECPPRHSRIYSPMEDTNIRIMATNLVGDNAVKRFRRGVVVESFVASGPESWKNRHEFLIVFDSHGKILLKRGLKSRPLPLDAIYELNRDPVFIDYLVPSPTFEKSIPMNQRNVDQLNASNYVKGADASVNQQNHYRNEVGKYLSEDEKRNGTSRRSARPDLFEKTSKWSLRRYCRHRVPKCSHYDHQSKSRYFCNFMFCATPPATVTIHEEFRRVRRQMRHFLLIRTHAQREPLVIIFQSQLDVEKFIDLLLFLQSYTGMNLANLVDPTTDIKVDHSFSLIRATALANQHSIAQLHFESDESDTKYGKSRKRDELNHSAFYRRRRHTSFWFHNSRV